MRNRHNAWLKAIAYSLIVIGICTAQAHASTAAGGDTPVVTGSFDPKSDIFTLFGFTTLGGWTNKTLAFFLGPVCEAIFIGSIWSVAHRIRNQQEPGEWLEHGTKGVITAGLICGAGAIYNFFHQQAAASAGAMLSLAQHVHHFAR